MSLTMRTIFKLVDPRLTLVINANTVIIPKGSMFFGGKMAPPMGHLSKQEVRGLSPLFVMVCANKHPKKWLTSVLWGHPTMKNIFLE